MTELLYRISTLLYCIAKQKRGWALVDRQFYTGTTSKETSEKLRSSPRSLTFDGGQTLKDGKHRKSRAISRGQTLDTIKHSKWLGKWKGWTTVGAMILRESNFENV